MVITKNKATVITSCFILRAKLGDVKSIEQFYKIIVPFIQAVINKNIFLINNHDTTDLAHDLFVKVYHHLNKFNPEKNIFPWVSTVVKNSLIDIYREQKRTKTVSLDAMFENRLHKEIALDFIQSPEETIIQHERHSGLYTILSQLSEINQLLIVGFYLEEKSLKQLSMETGLSTNSISLRLLRTKNKLKVHKSYFYPLANRV